MMFKYMCLVLFVTWYQLADCHPASSSSSIKSLDAMIDKESDAFLAVEAEESSHKAVRDKRTIGFLRQLFPNFSQIVDRKIQQLTRFVFRVIGRLVLRGGAGGGGGAGAAGGDGSTASGGDSAGGRRISITLPTYPPSTDDEDEEQTEMPAAAAEVPAAGAEVPDSRSAASGNDIASVSTISPNSEVAVTDPTPATDSSAGSSTPTAVAVDVTVTTPSAAVTTTNVTPTTEMPSVSDNTVGTSIVKRTAREVSTEESSSSSQQKRSPLTDTENDVSSDNGLSNTSDDAEKAESSDDPRNKRFLLNLRGGGGGGSGNFVFDLIRLIAGSGANQDKDEFSSEQVEEVQEVHQEANAKEDGYSVGVPGPLTRIFVIANRGVANLVQDLILRLAQTTERIVNFKARLITSLI